MPSTISLLNKMLSPAHAGPGDQESYLYVNHAACLVLSKAVHVHELLVYSG